MLSTVNSMQSSAGRLSTGLGHAYATLGLRAREARVDSIRTAAQKAAREVKQIAVTSMERESLLAEVATCAYRLLDPRKRVRQIERIQLCILSEHALELQAQSRRPLLQAQRRKAAVLQSA
ncbi:MAG: hypothetical protein U0930_00870 [Pirellulales bacterium]